MKLSQLKNMAGKLYRSIDNQQKYIKHRDATLRRYASYEDYVKIRHMGFEAVRDHRPNFYVFERP